MSWIFVWRYLKTDLSGKDVLPVYVFPRIRYKEKFLNDAPPGSIALIIPSGWIIKERFLVVP